MGRLNSNLIRKATRRRANRVGFVALNIALLLVVLGIVWLYPTRASSMPQPVATLTGTQSAAAPLDPLSSVDIALTVARMTDLPEMAAVTNQADSENIALSISSANNTVVNKPQSVISTFISNKDVHTYIVQPGDTLASVASKFGVTSDSILWSNNILTNSISTNEKLLIPPVSGIVYTVRAGDTTASLAAKFSASQSQIIADNDAEISGLQTGEQIIIPNGTLATPTIGYSSSNSSDFAWGSSAIYGFNGYDWGECTWYVATQISVPANWGDAWSWAEGARAAGWHVSSTPTVGAIAQTPYAAGGLGHVAIVDAVNSTGTLIEYRDMNGLAGFDRVGYSGWLPAALFPNYITAP
ncbi:MAG: CHAP domain-containing protein [Candidatus Saccharimonadales bacterium]